MLLVGAHLEFLLGKDEHTLMAALQREEMVVVEVQVDAMIEQPGLRDNHEVGLFHLDQVGSGMETGIYLE